MSSLASTTTSTTTNSSIPYAFATTNQNNKTNLNETYTINEIDIEINRPHIITTQKQKNKNNDSELRLLMDKEISASSTVKTNITITTRVNSSAIKITNNTPHSLSLIPRRLANSNNTLDSGIMSNERSGKVVNLHRKSMTNDSSLTKNLEKCYPPNSPRPKFYMLPELDESSKAISKVLLNNNTTLEFENPEYNFVSETPSKKTDSPNDSNAKSERTDFESFDESVSYDIFETPCLNVNVPLLTDTFHPLVDENNNHQSPKIRKIVVPMPSPNLKEVEIVDSHNEYLYLYSSSEDLSKYFDQRLIQLEEFMHESKLVKAILLTSVEPSRSDLEILAELYGENGRVSKRSVQCYVKFRREILETFKESLVKLSETKYFFLKNIKFGDVFPKHEFRSNFNL